MKLVREIIPLAAVALLMLIALALLDRRNHRALDELLERQDDLLRSSRALGDMQRALLGARLEERTLVDTHKPGHLASYREEVARARAMARRLQREAETLNIPALREQAVLLGATLDRYAESVAKTGALQGRLGLQYGADQGLLPVLRAREREVDAAITATKDASLTVAFTRARLLERDYSQSLNGKVAGTLIKTIDLISDALDRREDLAPHRREIGEPLAAYRSQVSELMSAVLERELVIAQNALEYEQVYPHISASADLLDAQQREAGASIRALRRSTNRENVTVFALGLLALIAVLALQVRAARRLARRVEQLAESMQDVADGNFDGVRELPEGADVAGVLAGAFRRMSGQLAEQIEALDKARARAEGASVSKSRFLANMSH
ncbi:MAG: hypothetical protein KC468_18170, partial [Myxococcales bacterium]|nr:hypothetical protein [Myxococcales bacterium]